MRKEEYHNNILLRNGSIMIGALLQDVAASIDVIITEPGFDKKSLPSMMEIAQDLYDAAEIVQSRMADTDDIDKALDNLDMMATKILKYREDLTD
jgi:5,10-methenyltetrahydromethanopterin hydrogenase